MATLHRAIEIAVKQHDGQFDKGGLPYILHPMRVLMMCKNDDERKLAAMHDLLEDTPITMDDLRAEGFSPLILECLDNLTRRKDETYADFIERCCNHHLSIRVKLYDIADNMDVTRLDNLTESDLGRVKRYHRARKRLLEVLAYLSAH